MGKYIDGSGLSHFMGILKGYFVPNTRTVNGHALSSDVTVTKSDVGLGNVTNTKQAPEAHASADTTYGLGSDSKYGHVKLSDTPSTLGNSSGGTAATPKSVADALTTVANGYLPKTAMVDGMLFSEGNDIVRYVVCSTAASTTTKTISINCKGLSTIPTGLVVHVEFSVTNTAAVGDLKFQLTVPASSGSGTVNVGSAVAIKYRGANLPSAGTLAANRIYTFVYDGTNWELIGDLDTDTTVAKTTTTPKMNGTAAVGSETKYAAGDHVHPTDTSRAAASHTHGNIYNDGSLTELYDSEDGPFALVITQGAAHKIVKGPGFGTSNTTFLSNDCSWRTPTDTKNTAGAGNVTSKLYLIGATSQTTSTTTYSNSKVYATDGALVATTFNGYTLAAACAKAVVTSVDTSASLPTSNAVKTYVDNSIGTATAGALQYKGTVSQESTITGASYKKGWYYVVATAGTYVGKVCEVGDMLIAKQDKTSTPANDWDAVQSNIEVLSNSEIDTLWAAA